MVLHPLIPAIFHRKETVVFTCRKIPRSPSDSSPAADPELMAVFHRRSLKLSEEDLTEAEEEPTAHERKLSWTPPDPPSRKTSDTKSEYERRILGIAMFR